MDEMRDGSWLLAGQVRVRPSAIAFEASRSSGPGGQHVNTSSTRVTLRCPMAALQGLDAGARRRLAGYAGGRLNLEQELVISCDSHRSQARNRQEVIERLESLVARSLVVPRRRRATRPTKGSVERRLQTKRQRSQIKARRRQSGSGDTD